MIDDGERRVFFSGDSGYFAGFSEIGRRFGPFDLTLMETGAYNVQWPYVHMHPEQTVQAHADLRGRWLLPIRQRHLSIFPCIRGTSRSSACWRWAVSAISPSPRR